MVTVPENCYVVIDDVGEIYLCNARCLCLWSMTLATKPELPEQIKMQPLKLNTSKSNDLEFESIVELAQWSAINALQTTLVKTVK